MTEHTTVTAPMPGVFYRRPDPDEPNFVEPGDDVEEGDVIGLVGVMKNFHDITAEADGEVVEFFVDNEQEVDAGDELATIDVA